MNALKYYVCSENHNNMTMQCQCARLSYTIYIYRGCCFNFQTDDLTKRFQQEVATLFMTWIHSDTGELINGIIVHSSIAMSIVRYLYDKKIIIKLYLNNFFYIFI